MAQELASEVEVSWGLPGQEGCAKNAQKAMELQLGLQP